MPTPLPWNTNVLSIPLDRPILVRLKPQRLARGVTVEHPVPIMVQRHSEKPDWLHTYLEQEPFGKFGHPLDEAEAWLDVAPPAATSGEAGQPATRLRRAKA